MPPSTTLETFPEDGIARVLAVVAHPDDMEYGLSGVVHHWTSRGIEVAYLLLTHGEAGMQRDPALVGPLRAAEQRAACDAVGVDRLTLLNHPDGRLMPTLDLRRDIAREIRAFRPDAVVTMTWDAVVPWGLNQADHRAAGLSALDACRDADNAWVFPDLAEAGLSPWGAQWLLVGGTDAPIHGVALSEGDVDAAVASLSAHQAYLADLGDHYPSPDDLLRPTFRAHGEGLGVPDAYAFTAYRLR
ncbi:PIG-L deacetylase family protein [Propioniciclava flava]|uniref:GlcNAc-PI de-N-acetylase n=1 Tax=Propioniciclava flava TaxID=2072026 RepID=A0A4Q2EH51_9ACTN|nr:PIG-L deacetylase family protein [Propioniciclava flava]RXW32877.1 GlcNAc-PI de-N-acetylase [Propioniciclava flava]